jgi:hypothetical protein
MVRALNSHAALLAACEALVTAWEAIPENIQVPDEINIDQLWDDVRAAIAAAKEKL